MPAAQPDPVLTSGHLSAAFFLSAFPYQCTRELSRFLSPLQTKDGIEKNLESEIFEYNFKTSFFDIFVSVPGIARGGAGVSQPVPLHLWPHLGGEALGGAAWGLRPPNAWHGDEDAGPLTRPDGVFFSKVLAFFRFFVLLLAYAVVRLRHWWVIAVRRQFLLSCF